MRKLLISAVILALPVTAVAFNDINDSDYKEAITYVKEENIVQGYEDGTYKPEEEINRAEFVKILIESKINKNPTEYSEDCFPDVKETDWFSSYVCYAKEEGIISGHEDGTFKPENEIKITEASKIIVNTLQLNPTENNEEWYSKFLEVLTNQNYLPTSISHVTNKVKRGEMAEMIWRIKEKITDKESPTLEDLTNTTCQDSGEQLPSNIDMNKVRNTWLNWTNTERSNLNLHKYTRNDQLERTATAWAETAEKRGYIDHKREGQSAYYDYNLINEWFQNQGLEFENIHRVTFTENINWGPYKCDQADCTDYLIEEIRYGFDFYMSEKEQEYRPHYNSVMNGYFNEIGLGIAIDEQAEKFYMAVHYGTKITSEPDPICQNLQQSIKSK